MGRFLLRRTAYTVPILLGVSLIVFLTVKIIPGDPVAALAGPGASEASKAALRARLGMDQPVPIQYLVWLGHALSGNLGDSIAQHQAATPLVFSAFGNTLILTGFAAVFALVLGLVIGGLGAFRPGGLVGRICSGISVLALSLPQYSVALVFIIYLAVRAGWFPVSGMYSTAGGGFGDLLRHAVLPAVTAGLVPAGVIARIFRAALLDVLGQDFVEALRARGLSPSRILLHAAHNTLPSLLTVAGLQIGYLLGGVVFVETIFSWPGLGLLVYQSITARDLPVIQAGVLVSALVFVLANLLVDAAHALVDARVRG
jgi:peptide/nickel transport system permease protein